MGPSKSKHQAVCFSNFLHLSENENKKMAVESGVAICKFFQSGYCKFKLTCKKKHVTTVCDDKMCNQKGCEKRHPRKCKYVVKYGNCKLGPICAYSHDDLNRKIENERLEKKIDELIKGTP